MLLRKTLFLKLGRDAVLSLPLGTLRDDEAADQSDPIRVQIRNLYKQEGKSTLAPVHTMKAQGGGGKDINYHH